MYNGLVEPPYIPASSALSETFQLNAKKTKTIEWKYRSWFGIFKTRSRLNILMGSQHNHVISIYPVVLSS